MAYDPLSMLAAAPPQFPTQRVLMWSAVMIGFLMVAWAVIGFIRRRHQASSLADHAPGFGLADLRALHEEGKLSDEEFERARGAIIARTKAALARREAEKAEREQRQRRREAGLPPELEIDAEADEELDEPDEQFGDDEDETGEDDSPPRR